MQLNEVLWPNKYLLMILGLWPMTFGAVATWRHHIFVFLRIFMVFISSISLLVPSIMTIFVKWGDVKILGDYGALTIFYMLVILKLLYYIIHRRRYVKMYQHIKDFWDITDNPEERKTYEKSAKLAKIATLACFWSGIGDVITYVIVAMITWIRKYREINNNLYPRPLLLDLHYGFDTQPMQIYALIFIWQTISTSYLVCAAVGGDCAMMTLVLHITGQFRLINARFRAIGRKINQQVVLKNIEKELHDEIANLITQHQHLIKITKQLDELMSPLIFGQIMSSGMVICLSGYAVIEGSNDAIEVIKFLMLLLSLLLQLVIWCFPAECLIQESSAIADTIYYEISWFQLKPRQRRDLNFILARAQKGSHVSAFYQIMSIRRLTEVLNAAGAYMTVLRSMRK